MKLPHGHAWSKHATATGVKLLTAAARKAATIAAGRVSKAVVSQVAGSKRSAADASISTVQQDTSKVYKKRKLSDKKKAKIAFAKKVRWATKTDTPFNLFKQTQQTAIGVNKTSVAGTINQQYVGGNTSVYGINYGTLISTTVGLPFYLGKIIADPASDLSITAPKLATGAPAAASTDNVNMYITHQRFSIALSNTTGYPLVFDVYQFVAAIDINQAAFANPYNAWVQGLQDAETYTDNRPTVNTNGMTPLDTPGFGKYWKLLKKDRIYLSGGAQAEIPMTGLHKRRVKLNNIQNKYAMKGLTQYFLVVGGIGDDGFLPDGSGTPQKVFETVCSQSTHVKVDGDGINGVDRPVVFNEYV